jgi:DNA-binding transcriptional LysR family regulator
MDLRRLRYFTVLAEEKHFGRAARRLAMSQPPLSLAIRQLEHELQTPLFDRNSRNVELTRAGLALQREAELLLRRLDETKALVKAVAEGKEGRLRVGFGGAMLHRGLPEMVEQFRQTYPGIDLSLQELNTTEQVEALKRNEIDFGFLQGATAANGLNNFRFHSEPFVACLPEQHPLAHGRKLDLAKLKGDEFVLFSRASSPHYFESIVTICLAHGFMPNIKHEVRHWSSVVAFVESGMGVSLVPKTLSGRRPTTACFISFSAPHGPSETWCAWKASPADAPGLPAMIEVAKTQAKKLNSRLAGGSLSTEMTL